MGQRYRVALHGFSAFERSALAFCLRHAGARVPAYEQAESLADSDFVVADAHLAPSEGSALRADRLGDTLFVGDEPPCGAAASIPRPLDPEGILRALDRIVIQRLAASRSKPLPGGTLAPAAVAQPGNPEAPAVPAPAVPVERPQPAFEIRFADLSALDKAAAPATMPPRSKASPPPELPRLVDAVEAPPARTPAPVRPLTLEERRAAKEEARRRSRAARLAQTRRDRSLVEHVLLLDGVRQDTALERLLQAFGFRVVRATDVAGAMGVLESTPLAAAFLDIAAPGDDEIDSLALCQLVRRGRLALAGDMPPLLLLSASGSASEGVRARLAGCDAFLTQPVSRGDVARALEACSVPLPAEPRRIPR